MSALTHSFPLLSDSGDGSSPELPILGWRGPADASERGAILSQSLLHTFLQLSNFTNNQHVNTLYLAAVIIFVHFLSLTHYTSQQLSNQFISWISSFYLVANWWLSIACPAIFVLTNPSYGSKFNWGWQTFPTVFFCVQSVEMSVDTFFIDHFPFLHPLTQFSLAISHIDASLCCEEHYIWCTTLRGHMTHTSFDVNIINSTIFFTIRAH